MKYTVKKKSFLLEYLIELGVDTRKKLKSYLVHGSILINNRVTTKYDASLKVGDVVEINSKNSKGKSSDSRLDILYEDRDIIAVNKPCGLLTMATDSEKEQTMYHIVRDYIKQINPKIKVFIVHRLDKETSGVLLFAKSEKMKQSLQDNWDSLVKKRGYVALVEGVLTPKEGTVHSWLKETQSFLVYSSKVKGDGKEAITNYQVIKENTENSLVEIFLETGRKNQIRVHMKDMHHSIVGDKKYGATTNPIKRLGLHAHLLVLEHPITHKLVTLESPVPKIFEKVIQWKKL